ncbi:uncharacterized protein CIMG_01144 [Coccidioides immitis RS]|uniref:Secreted protein n=2 Tax=Coccidioides immitis TaxID=5501 RepID=J3KIJ2_COCIM|nr:uncharacterized protein CIMG_01144 [Coccidioides immitis RS]EAS35790.3 hypothetical protein CIMG_01144 [Coccidioides immitis RS]KMU72688.1 hypothetical protein CISG_03123 [Coccidioides immitis RMSCC 3703]
MPAGLFFSFLFFFFFLFCPLVKQKGVLEDDILPNRRDLRSQQHNLHMKRLTARQHTASIHRSVRRVSRYVRAPPGPHGHFGRPLALTISGVTLSRLWEVPGLSQDTPFNTRLKERVPCSQGVVSSAKDHNTMLCAMHVQRIRNPFRTS